MSNEQIEASILNSFLHLDNIYLQCKRIDGVFTLDERIFTSPLRVAIAKKLNDIKDDSYGMADMTIADKVRGTDHEEELLWIWSMPTMSLVVARAWHDSLSDRVKKESLCAL